MSKYYDFGVTAAVSNEVQPDNIIYFDFGVRSKLVSQQLKKASETVDASAEQLAKFTALKEEKKTFSITFDKITENGDLSTVIDGVKVVLPNKTSDGHLLFDASDREKRADRLVLSYNVKVLSINEEEKCVILETLRLNNRELVIKRIDKELASTKAIAAKAVESAKARVDAYIEQEAAKFAKMSKANVDKFRLIRTNEEIIRGYQMAGIELITVPARITKVEQNFLICDIMGFGIPGKLFKNDWSFHTNGNLNAVANVGDVIDVCIKGLNNNKTAGGKLEENKALYLCTRLPLLENPWENLDIQRNDDIKVKCTNIKATCWFGMANGTELEVYGEFAEDREIQVVLGETYLCHVYKCDPEMRTVKVRPVNHIPA